MDHVTHSVLLWIIVGTAVTAIFLWLVMVSSSEGRRLDPELDRLLAEHRVSAPAADDTSRSQRANDLATGDRFRLLGDPEYGLFLDEVGPSSVPVSAA